MECLQFALRASLTDLETKRDREIYPPSVVMLDSDHKVLVNKVNDYDKSNMTLTAVVLESK